MLSHSATRAGFSSFSISTRTAYLNDHCPGTFSRALISVKRPRMRLPDLTGMAKRTLSNP